MGTRVFRNTTYSVNVVAESDVVIMDCPVPAECQQHNVWAEMHAWGIEADALDWDQATMYGLEAWVIPVPDPDTALDLNTLWDRFVPKDTEVASGAFDLDPATAVTGSFFDLGEVNLDAVMDMSNLRSEHQWYSRRKMLSWANSRVNLTPGTPDLYSAQDVHKIRARKTIAAEYMSWSVMAFGAPSLTDLDSSRSTYASEALWMQTKYIDVVLEQAWVELVGLTEAGAETPWTDAALAVQDLVEPEPVGGTGTDTANFANMDYHVFANATFEIEVPGRREVSVISGGR